MTKCKTCGSESEESDHLNEYGECLPCSKKDFVVRDDPENRRVIFDAAVDPQPKPPRITRTRWQLVRWHLRCAWLHMLGRL